MKSLLESNQIVINHAHVQNTKHIKDVHNRLNYAILKRDGKLIQGHWVAMIDGRLAAMSEKKTHVLKVVVQKKERAYVVQVGDENRKYEMDAVDCFRKPAGCYTNTNVAGLIETRNGSSLRLFARE